MVSVCRLAPRRLGLLDLAFARASACYTWAGEGETDYCAWRWWADALVGFVSICIGLTIIIACGLRSRLTIIIDW
jgi:hypothetical protein